MRCKKCGAEIGEERVCPFCDTPIKNVLVADRTDKGIGINKEDEAAKLPQYSSEAFNSDETTVLNLDSIDGLKDQEKVSPEKDEDKIDCNTMDDIEEVSQDLEKEPSKIRTSVIPDYKINERKRWSKKRKILTLVSAFFIVLIIIIVSAGVYIFKQYKKYIKGLKESDICFIDEMATPLDACYYIDKNEELVEVKNVYSYLNRSVEKKDADQWIKTNENALNYVISSKRNYAAYQINGSYTYIEEGYKPSENKTITMHTFDLYLEKEDQEIVKIYHEEKKEGIIEVAGVTDEGEIIYNDTEKNKAFMVSCSSAVNEIGEKITKALFYKEDGILFLQADGQLIYKKKTGDSQVIVASDVNDVFFSYGDERYGYIISFDQTVISTDSENLFIIYKNNKDEYYLKDLRSDMADSVKIDKNSIKIDSIKIYEISDKDDESSVNDTNERTDGKKLKIKEADISNKDLSGDGELYITDKGLEYKLKFYHRNLGSADKILALDGRYAYVIKNGKTVRIDVFTKKEKVLFDKKMQIKFYFMPGNKEKVS